MCGGLVPQPRSRTCVPACRLRRAARSLQRRRRTRDSSPSPPYASHAGFFFGRTPLIQLSPKKTWEGFLGGCVGTGEHSVRSAARRAGAGAQGRARASRRAAARSSAPPPPPLPALATPQQQPSSTHPCHPHSIPIPPALPAVVAAWYGSLLMSQFRWFTCPRQVGPGAPRWRWVGVGQQPPARPGRCRAAPLHCRPPHTPAAPPAPSPGPERVAAHALYPGARDVQAAHFPPGRCTGACGAAVPVATSGLLGVWWPEAAPPPGRPRRVLPTWLPPRPASHPAQQEGANPAVVDLVYSVAPLLPPRLRGAVARFSFTCLPMQLHAVRCSWAV